MPGEEMVPSYMVGLAADVAAIKERTSRLGTIEHEIGELRTSVVSKAEFAALETKTNTLWDEFHEQIGHRRWERRFLYGVSVLSAAVTTYATVGHQLHLF